MQAFAPDSPMFDKDQRPAFAVEFWDTVFTPLVNEVASGGIQMTLREPRHSDGAFSMLADLSGAAASGAAAAFNAAAATTVVDAGRTPNLIGYWAAGAPGYHGAAYAGRVAYRFEGWVRAASARDWFSASTTFTATVACVGNGYFRVVKNGTTDLINASMTEKSYLQDSGPLFSAAAVSLTVGDKLDFYYVEDGTSWGGFAFKLIPGDVTAATTATKLAALRDAPVVGCGLLDDNGAASPTSCPKRTLRLVRPPVEVNRTTGQTARASFEVPLANTQVWDGVGWEWVRSTGDQAGILRLHDFQDDGAGGVTPVTFDVKRQRLIRIRAGFVLPNATIALDDLFTGFVDDFENASSGTVTVRCLGIEQRLADQYVKNYPDKISYMAYGYKKVSGTSEPVYGIAAYDNWPLEYVVRDLMIRAGVDESRTRAPLRIPLSDGSYGAVVM